MSDKETGGERGPCVQWVWRPRQPLMVEVGRLMSSQTYRSRGSAWESVCFTRASCDSCDLASFPNFAPGREMGDAYLFISCID